MPERRRVLIQRQTGMDGVSQRFFVQPRPEARNVGLLRTGGGSGVRRPRRGFRDRAYQGRTSPRPSVAYNRAGVMKVDIWKSATLGRRLVSVPAGVALWDIVERAKLPPEVRDAKLYRRGVDLDRPLPLALDIRRVMQEINARGYALHVA